MQDSRFNVRFFCTRAHCCGGMAGGCFCVVLSPCYGQGDHGSASHRRLSFCCKGHSFLIHLCFILLSLSPCWPPAKEKVQFCRFEMGVESFTKKWKTKCLGSNYHICIYEGHGLKSMLVWFVFSFSVLWFSVLWVCAFVWVKGRPWVEEYACLICLFLVCVVSLCICVLCGCWLRGTLITNLL